jgi:nitrogen fixation NifU-like protein
MATMGQLYQEVILDHNRKPRNYRAMDDATCDADGYNPLCGDKVHVWLRLGADGRIEDVSFQGEGCAISKASASIMTQELKGRTAGEARALFDRFHEVVTGRAAPESVPPRLGLFAGVSAFPTRVKCASLGWHTMKAALEGSAAATTE